MIPYCQHDVRAEDRAAVAKVLDSSRLTQGPAGRAFEAGLAERLGAAHAVAVSSGTSALQIALQAMNLASGDEVLVPSLTFLATANAVLLAGGRPVFVDIDPATLAMCPEDMQRRISPRTRGAVVVHYAGHAANVSLYRSALGTSRFLIEDACHALGASRDGVAVGSDSDAACFSFHPAKHITTGEGGAIVTRGGSAARHFARLREHGMERESASFTGLGLPESQALEESGGWVYEMQSLSGNHRLSDLAAGLGLSQLARLEENLAARKRIAERYVSAFADADWLRLLDVPAQTESAWHLFPIRLEIDRIEGGRAAVYQALHAAGIGVQVHYIPVHLQPFYRERSGTRFGDLPSTEDAYLRLLSLPLFPELSQRAQDHVIEVLCSVVEERLR
ncbi:MAG: DegT/DnrJ/EryC1/StrS family aminotransferase [Myxococcota bacterium]